MQADRRSLLGLALGGGLALATRGHAKTAARVRAPAPRDDIAIGNVRAPVTVVEYASLGCPHCAAWATDVWPRFKAKYVDAGKVRFVLREMLTGNTNLAAAGFLMARCAGPANYFRVVEGVFGEYDAMVAGESPFDGLMKVARSVGLSEAQVDACLKDEKALAALQARERRAEADGVNSTPTFVVAGRTLDDEHTFEVISAAVDKALKARGRR